MILSVIHHDINRTFFRYISFDLFQMLLKNIGYGYTDDKEKSEKNKTNKYLHNRGAKLH